MTRSVLFVLGMHAGGAAALAAALGRAGAALGTAATPTVDEGSGATGNAGFSALSDQVLAQLGIAWDALAAPPERWPESAPVRALAPAAGAWIAKEFGDAATVVVADPRACRLFAFWRTAFEAADFKVSAVLVVRRPHEVAVALAKRLQFAPEKSLALWLAHLADAERGSRGLRRALVTYDALVTDAGATLARVAAEAGFPLAGTAAAQEAARAIVKALRAADPASRKATGIGSGLDAALDEGYTRLAALAAGTDPRREIEAIAVAARPALNAAIPPWLVNELDAARLAAQRLGTEVTLARQRENEAQRELATMRANPPPDPRVLAQQFDALRADHARERDALLAQLEAARADQSRERSSLLAQLEGTHGDLARLSAAVAEAPRAEATLREDLSQTQRDLVDERATIMRLSDEIESTRREAEGNAHRFESARYHLEALATELAQTRGAVQARENDYAMVAEEVDGLRIRLADLQSDRDATRKEADEALRRHANVVQERDAIRRDLAVATTERDALAQIVRETGDALAALREELPRRAAVEASLAQERDRLATDLRAATERAASLENQLHDRAAALADLTQRHNALVARLAELDRNSLVRAAMWVGGMPHAGKAR